MLDPEELYITETVEKDGFIWKFAQNVIDGKWWLFISNKEPKHGPNNDKYMGYSFEIPDEIIEKLGGKV